MCFSIKQSLDIEIYFQTFFVSKVLMIHCISVPSVTLFKYGYVSILETIENVIGLTLDMFSQTFQYRYGAC